MSQSTATGHLTPTPPFDFAQSLAFLGGFRPAAGEQTVDEQSLTKAVMLAGQVVAFQVANAGTIEAPGLDYTLVANQPLSAAGKAAAVDRIRFFLSLDDDLRPFYAVAQADPPFATVTSHLYGLHQMKFLTPFENACWAILSQRNLLAVARRMKQGLTERYGGSVTVEGTTHWAFPEAAELAGANPDELRAVIGNERKAGQVQAAAQAFRTVDEGWLRAAPSAEVEAWLRAIPGIGTWSAYFVLVRGLGRMDRLPQDEKHLLGAAERVYGGPMTQERLETLAAPYGLWRGYWSYYLRAAG